MTDRLPYPGLRAYTREESDLFFGRDADVMAMIDLLARTRLLAVLGSSGSGKSSLVKAGLLDVLDLGLMADAEPDWVFVTMQPGKAPIRNLAAALLEAFAKNKDTAGDPEYVDATDVALHLGPRALVEWYEEGHLPPRTNLLILVDQFEELFRYGDFNGRDEAEAFVALLLEAVREKDRPVYVVLTMRSEFLGDCATIPDLARHINKGLFLTPRMTRAMIREAIVRPAEVCNTGIDKALVAHLLNDIESFAPWKEKDALTHSGSPSTEMDLLPLVQHTLNQMWRNAAVDPGSKPNTLGMDGYRRMRGLTGAIQETARIVREELTSKPNLQITDELIRDVFLSLVTGDDSKAAVRNPRTFHKIVSLCGASEDAVREVVNAFRDCNFLTPRPDMALTGATTVDISHESLIRQWPDLRDWLDQDVKMSDEWLRLVKEMHSFNERKGDLLSGNRLQYVLDWMDENKPTSSFANRHVGQHNEVLEFINKSKFASDLTILNKKVKKKRRVAALTGLTALSITAASIMYLLWMSAKENLNLSRNLTNDIANVIKNPEISYKPGYEELLQRIALRVLQSYGKINESSNAQPSLQELQIVWDAGRRAQQSFDFQGSIKIFKQAYNKTKKGPEECKESGLYCQLHFITGIKLAQSYRMIGAKKDRELIMAELAQVAPRLDSPLPEDSDDALEYYAWYLGEYQYSTEIGNVPEKLRMVRKRLNDAALKLAARRPRDHNALYLAGRSSHMLADSHRGDPQGEFALELREQALDHLEKALKAAPGNSIYMSNRAVTLAALAEDMVLSSASEEVPVRALEKAEEATSNMEELLKSTEAPLILDDAATVFSVHSDILRKAGVEKRRDVVERTARLLDISIKRLPSATSSMTYAGVVRDNLATMIWDLQSLGDLNETVERCGRAAQNLLQLPINQRDGHDVQQLVASALSCATTGQETLDWQSKGNAPNSGRGFLNQVLARHKDYIVNAFKDPSRRVDEDYRFHAQMGAVILHMAQTETHDGFLKDARETANTVIDTLTQRKKELLYDYYAMKLISDAHFTIADGCRKKKEIQEAHTHLAACSDPGQVPYPSVDCMTSRADLIESGLLGTGQDDTARRLRSEASYWRTTSVPVTITVHPGMPPETIQVLVAPRQGSEGITDQVIWFRRVEGIEIPEKVQNQFRLLQMEAQNKNIPFADYAAENMNPRPASLQP